MYGQTQPPSQYVGPPPIVRRLHTPAGLKYGSYGMLLGIITSILSLITVIPLATSPDLTNMTAPTIAFIVGMACLVSILALVMFIFWILLLYEMHVGRREFGPRHASRVSAGIILIVLGIVLMIVGIIATVAAAFIGFDPSGGVTDIDAAQFRTSMAVGLVFTIASAVAINLALVFFAREIIEPEKMNLLWAAFALAVAAPIISSLITISSIPTSGVIDMAEADTIAPWANVAEIFSLIGTALFFVAYRAARQRILDGRLQPVFVQPMQPPPQYPQQPPAWGQPPPPRSEEPPKWEELEPVDEPRE
ncbi:MAG: hypothetical protein V3V91_02205 [Thermoplasmata archaeon]